MNKAMLEAARGGFPGNPLRPRTERELVHLGLVRANVLMENAIGCVVADMELTDHDPLWHDLHAIHAAIGQAQEFLR